MTEQSGPKAEKSDHQTGVRITEYYTAACYVCGVLGQFGYDKAAAERCAESHRIEHNG